jgi:DNA-binding SARP family transcriptional activator
VNYALPYRVESVKNASRSKHGNMGDLGTLPMPTMLTYSLKILGKPELRGRCGSELPIKGHKQRALLAYLALNPDYLHPREVLASLLWGEHSEVQARQSLRQALLAFRRLFGPSVSEILRIDAREVSFTGAACRTDATEFMREALSDQPEKAAALYHGELLEGVHVHAEP